MFARDLSREAQADCLSRSVAIVSAITAARAKMVRPELEHDQDPVLSGLRFGLPAVFSGMDGRREDEPEGGDRNCQQEKDSTQNHGAVPSIASAIRTPAGL